MTDLSAPVTPRLALGESRGPSLATILAALPPDTLLPVRWLREQLALDANVEATRGGTVSAPEFGALRRPPRTADWVREKCALGVIKGAFKDGGEWRVPRAALTEPPSSAREDGPQRSAQQGSDPETPPKGRSRYPRW